MLNTTIYLVRHGDYISPQPVIPYRMPGFLLSETGRKQVEKLAKTLGREPVAAVFTSRMERTLATAEILANAFARAPTVDDRLLEVRSPAQGKSQEFIDGLGGWHIYDTPWYRERGGETLDEIAGRVLNIIEEKLEEYPGKAVILVSHGDPIMLAAAHYAGLPRTADAMERWPYVPKAGGYRLEFQPQNEVKIYPIVAT